MKELPREDSTDDGKVTAKKMKEMQKKSFKKQGKTLLGKLWKECWSTKLNALSLQGTSTSILISRQN